MADSLLLHRGSGSGLELADPRLRPTVGSGEGTGSIISYFAFADADEMLAEARDEYERFHEASRLAAYPLFQSFVHQTQHVLALATRDALDVVMQAYRGLLATQPVEDEIRVRPQTISYGRGRIVERGRLRISLDE